MLLKAHQYRTPAWRGVFPTGCKRPLETDVVKSRQQREGFPPFVTVVRKFKTLVLNPSLSQEPCDKLTPRKISIISTKLLKLKGSIKKQYNLLLKNGKKKKNIFALSPNWFGPEVATI